jgi:hypothetical protein
MYIPLSCVHVSSHRLLQQRELDPEQHHYLHRVPNWPHNQERRLHPCSTVQLLRGELSNSYLWPTWLLDRTLNGLVGFLTGHCLLHTRQKHAASRGTGAAVWAVWPSGRPDTHVRPGRLEKKLGPDSFSHLLLLWNVLCSCSLATEALAASQLAVATPSSTQDRLPPTALPTAPPTQTPPACLAQPRQLATLSNVSARLAAPCCEKLLRTERHIQHLLPSKGPRKLSQSRGSTADSSVWGVWVRQVQEQSVLLPSDTMPCCLSVLACTHTGNLGNDVYSSPAVSKPFASASTDCVAKFSQVVDQQW